MSNRDPAIKYIADQLDSICERPEMWGPNLCVELQYLMLMDFWLFQVRLDLEQQNPRLVRDEFCLFCKRKGYPGNFPLADAVANVDDFKQALQSFRDEFVKRIVPVSPFEQHDLTVAYNLRKGHALSESVVSHGLANVRRVLRAAVRPAKARQSGGRSRKEIEALTDFEVVDVEIHPQNGIGTRVVIPMRQQQPAQQDWAAQAVVRDAIGALVEMAEWANDITAPPPIVGQPQDRDWIAWQTMKLLPGADVESMELGGKLVSRSRPVVLKASQRPRLFSVLESSLTSTPYGGIGAIRALDRDTYVIKFREDGSTKNIECWILSAETLQVAEQNLCSKVKIQGRRFSGVARRPVVLVDDIAVVEHAPDDDLEEGGD